MKIMDFLSKRAVIPEIKSTKKQEVIKELVDALIAAGELEKRHRNKLFDALQLIFHRESFIREFYAE